MLVFLEQIPLKLTGKRAAEVSQVRHVHVTKCPSKSRRTGEPHMRVGRGSAQAMLLCSTTDPQYPVCFPKRQDLTILKDK